MSVDEFLVIGAGPAGTSAALALARKGRAVRIVDAGSVNIDLPPEGEYSELRHCDAAQWRWQLGNGQHAVPGAGSPSSPKLRIPGLSRIFEGYAEANRIRAEGGFQLAGVLAAGGMSNVWGCGVATFDAAEMAPLDVVQRQSLKEGYERAALRMGLSGANPDALSALLGLDGWAAPPLALDVLHARLWARRQRIGRDGLRLGRARVAVIGTDHGGRSGCDYSGMCLWGCARGATWSAVHDVATLLRLPSVTFEEGTLVERLVREEEAWRVDCRGPDGLQRRYLARRVLLAAGTIASTRLALGALENPPGEIRLLSNPMAAFLLLRPDAIGIARGRSFGLAQLSFALQDVASAESAFGNLFSTAGLPVSEFLGHLPVTRRAGLPLLRALLPAIVVGNVFLPGHLSTHAVRLDANGDLRVRSDSGETVSRTFHQVRRRLRREFSRLGAWMLPGSFVKGAPGADLHYAGTMPMRALPQAHECFSTGEVAGLRGVYAIDGASLPMLPAKPHTLTIMANADRIASALE